MSPYHGETPKNVSYEEYLKHILTQQKIDDKVLGILEQLRDVVLEQHKRILHLETLHHTDHK